MISVQFPTYTVFMESITLQEAGLSNVAINSDRTSLFSVDIIKYGMKLLIHSQTSTMQPLQFANGEVISTPLYRPCGYLSILGIKFYLLSSKRDCWSTCTNQELCTLFAFCHISLSLATSQTINILQGHITGSEMIVCNPPVPVRLLGEIVQGGS